jgi:outer membrane lipoprotein-sorting protein
MRFKLRIMKKLFIILLLFCMPANAAELQQKIVALPNDQLIKDVENYLGTLKTISADFLQVSSVGSVSGGKFYMQRPKKFRWEYDKRNPILIISTGKQLVYYDKKLKELTYLPTDNSLINFLSREPIKLSGDVKLLSIGEFEGGVRAIITQTKKPEEGKLAMYFSKKPMKLLKLEVIDADKNITSVLFKNLVVGSTLPKDVFVFRNPKYTGNAWEKKK